MESPKWGLNNNGCNFVFVCSLSPAAQRTAPLLKTLTPDKKGLKYHNGGAVTAAAGIAAMLALTTPLAMDGQQTLKEFQLERQKVNYGLRTLLPELPENDL
jgi:hypothetical protein